MTGWASAVTGTAQPKPHRLRNLLLGTTIPFLGISVGITQWLAAQLRYHPSLGWNIAGWYAPWDWLIWRYLKAPSWPKAAPTFELLDQFLAIGLCFLPAVLALVAMQGRAKPKRHEGVHGTAKFATRQDKVVAGLLPEKPTDEHGGLYLAVDEDGAYLRHQGPEAVMVTAPQRSGKTQGPVLLNVLSGADESVIVYDVRGDVYSHSAGWRRRQGNRVLKWDMLAEADTGAVRWNPLAEVRLGSRHEFGDVANIIEMVADPSGEGLDNPKDHFPPVAAAFLNGLALFCLYEARARGRQGSFGDVRHAMSDPGRLPDALYQAMVQNRVGAGGTRHDVIARAGAAQLARPDRERASVLSTCTRMLRLWDDPEVVRCTEVSDFRLRDIMDGPTPAALYIMPGEAHALRLRPLFRLFMSMLAKYVLDGDFTGSTSKAHKYRARLLWDEFPEAKKMDAFVDSMARLGGAGLRVVVFVQDHQQIVREYGREEPITGHSHLILGYTPNDPKTAEWMEGWVGRTTLVTEDVSESGSSGDAKRGYSRHFSTVSRPLLTSDEIGRMPKPRKDREGRIIEPGKVLLKVGGSPVVLASQALYFFDPVFQARAAVPAP